MKTPIRSEDLPAGYLACPTEAAHPGVVMIHDVWGLSDHTRDYARRLATEGFAVLALDLYRRERALGDVSITDPGAFMRKMSDPAVLGDVQSGVDLLAGRAEVESHGVGVLGFCMGGMYALLAGCELARIGAVVPFYGILSHHHGLLYDPDGLDPASKPVEPLDAAKNLRCPMLAFFGDQDEFIPIADIEELRARLATNGKDAEVVVYQGAGHAFMNDTRPAAFRAEAAKAAWAKTVGFLRRRLVQPPRPVQ